MSADPETTQILYLDGAVVSELLETLDPVAVARETLVDFQQGRAGLSPEAALRWTASDQTAARSLYLPAWQGQSYGAKLINACIGNPARGLARANGLIVLFDRLSARPTAILEGAQISALRTAAVSLSALLALTDLTSVRSLGLLGSGTLARAHLDLLLRQGAPLEQVNVFDLDRERAEALEADYRATVPVAVVSAPRSAVAGISAVVAATTTTTPYVDDAWLEAGSVFLNVSLDDATESLLLSCDFLVVDDWDLIVNDEHRLLGRLARTGQVCGPDDPPGTPGRRVNASLSALVTDGRPDGWASSDQRVVVNPFGMGIHDIALAARVVEAARSGGTGRWLPR